jgi:hypothetical protein
VEAVRWFRRSDPVISASFRRAYAALTGVRVDGGVRTAGPVHRRHGAPQQVSASQGQQFLPPEAIRSGLFTVGTGKAAAPGIDSLMVMPKLFTLPKTKSPPCEAVPAVVPFPGAGRQRVRGGLPRLAARILAPRQPDR